jgi:hypothetical protein
MHLSTCRVDVDPFRCHPAQQVLEKCGPELEGKGVVLRQRKEIGAMYHGEGGLSERSVLLRSDNYSSLEIDRGELNRKLGCIRT